ncbi:hypothetical protein ACFW04_000123 [Cataglyphis niger]
MQNFGTSDYTVFAVMLIACGFVGIYFGFVNKSSGEDEYLVGGRNMKTFPVSLSLIASFISGISLLGTPTEVYVHGTSYLFIGCAVIFVGLVMSIVFLPVFHELKLTSTYEYLEKRFDKRIRLLGSILFAIGIGGLKAVVWTDFIQTFIMFGSMLLIIIKGTADVGGLSLVIRRNLESGRLELPTIDWSPLTRHTIWALTIGGFVHWLQISAINQNMIQRYLSLPTLQSARRALWCFIIGVLILIGMCGYAGLLIYAWYHECDPLTTKLARAKDQLLPLLVMNVLGKFPGLPGLFVAGVFSAALREPWALYRLSYLWYTMTGALMTISVGLLVTLITSQNVEKLDPMLLAPFMRKYLKTSSKDITPEELHQVKVFYHFLIKLFYYF